jgi:hypothetical protein
MKPGSGEDTRGERLRRSGGLRGAQQDPECPGGLDAPPPQRSERTGGEVERRRDESESFGHIGHFERSATK